MEKTISRHQDGGRQKIRACIKKRFKINTKYRKREEVEGMIGVQRICPKILLEYTSYKPSGCANEKQQGFFPYAFETSISIDGKIDEGGTIAE